jgi:hypothetical protein
MSLESTAWYTLLNKGVAQIPGAFDVYLMMKTGRLAGHVETERVLSQMQLI